MSVGDDLDRKTNDPKENAKCIHNSPHVLLPWEHEERECDNEEYCALKEKDFEPRKERGMSTPPRAPRTIARIFILLCEKTTPNVRGKSSAPHQNEKKQNKRRERWCEDKSNKSNEKEPDTPEYIGNIVAFSCERKEKARVYEKEDRDDLH